MTGRPRINQKVLTSVLLRSRRRCCICFGLNRDTDLKSGQVAHLNQKRSDNREENLCFLCLLHHDEYDSRTSQRKNFTEAEVKAFRAELYSHLARALALPVRFGEVSVPAEDPYAGTWIRTGGNWESAEITLTPVADSLEGSPRYAVSGIALWGRGREFGPNIGDFSFVAEMHGSIIHHFEDRPSDDRYEITMRFQGQTLSITEKNWIGRYGMNVHFEGEYQRPPRDE